MYGVTSAFRKYHLTCYVSREKYVIVLKWNEISNDLCAAGAQ